MKFRRQETFRYQFENPINCLFRILKVDSKELTSKIGKAYVNDISEGGIKISSPLSIPLENKVIEIELIFKLNQEDLILTGTLAWRKDHFNNQYSYGVQLTIDESLKKQLIQELKIYSKGIALIKKKNDPTLRMNGE